MGHGELARAVQGRGEGEDEGGGGVAQGGGAGAQGPPPALPVSYTHLTLPTNREV